MREFGYIGLASENANARQRDLMMGYRNAEYEGLLIHDEGDGARREIDSRRFAWKTPKRSRRLNARSCLLRMCVHEGL